MPKVLIELVDSDLRIIAAQAKDEHRSRQSQIERIIELYADNLRKNKEASDSERRTRQ